LLNLQTVFVGASEEVHVVAQKAVPTGKCVTNNGGVRMTKVGLRIHIINWRC